MLVGSALLMTASPPSPLPPPLPPLAPVAPPPLSSFAPAPMPDQDMQTPSSGASGNGGATVSPGLSRPGSGPTYQSGGFTPGSTYNNTQDNRFRPMPTINLSVPLQ